MIGIFDSGVGGLTVAKEVFKYLPEYQTIYFGDTARLPYGTKGEAFVKKYSKKIVEWLLRHGAQIIVVACHTSSAWAAEAIRSKFPSVPVFDMVAPPILQVTEATKNKKIGIVGTPGTIKSAVHRRKLLERDKFLQVYEQACPLFVPLVEEGWANNKITQEIAEIYLKPLQKQKIDALLLACTHYPLLEKIISKIMGKEVAIINPAESVAKSVQEFLNQNPGIASKIKKGDRHRFVFSDVPYHLQEISALCFQKKIDFSVHDPFFDA